MIYGVLKEADPAARPPETRVALTPESAKTLMKKSHTVLIEAGAGEAAFFSDASFVAAGCRVVADRGEVLRGAECLLRVTTPKPADVDQIPEGKALVSYLWALRSPQLVEALRRRRVTSFSLDAIPRISRAQSMDVLSSMSTVAGYKSVILAAQHLGKFMPMFSTAAGTIKPAQGLIIGAGVAGLQAIATARRLGAIVEAYDTRPVVKEQVKSLGATFVEVKAGPDAPDQAAQAQDAGGYAKERSAEHLARERQLLRDRVRAADFVITTALVPGKPAPRLIDADAVGEMKAGSVIVDLAAETGGNCALTQANQTTVHKGVTILGPTNLPALLPVDASRMFARNMVTFLLHITGEKGFTWDWTDEIFSETCITHEGGVKNKKVLGGAA